MYYKCSTKKCNSHSNYINMIQEWFKHDIAASEDDVILQLRASLGHAGYGIWWLIVERMYRDGGSITITSTENLAYALRVPIDELKRFMEVSEDIGLIDFTDEVTFTNRRVAMALDERDSLSKKRTRAIQERYKCSTSVVQMKNTSTTSVLQKKKKSKSIEYKNTLSLETPQSTSFEAFWSSYDHKVDRQSAERVWGRLTPDEQTAIMDHVHKYVASTPDKKYRRHPATYLNRRTWENPIQEPTHASHQRPHHSGPRHIPAAQLISDDLERRRRLGISDDGGALGSDTLASEVVQRLDEPAGNVPRHQAGANRRDAAHGRAGAEPLHVGPGEVG